MVEAEASYAGDAQLEAALAAAGVAMPVAAVRDLVAGVAAAPDGYEDWTVLVAPNANAALRDQLNALRAEIAAAADGMFPYGPAPAERLAALQAEIVRRGLDGFIVPRTDEHQGEYVPMRAERLRWVTGFSGSAGVAVVLAERAAVFVDGRYTLQVLDEVDTEQVEPVPLADKSPWDWIAENLADGATLGYDPLLLTESSVARYRQAAEKAGGRLVAVDDNPVDAVWPDQPAAPLAPVVVHDEIYAGDPAVAKRATLGVRLTEENVAAAVLTMPDSIAWLLNIRGGDVPHTPLPLSFAILRDDGSVDLFVDARKLSPGVTEHLGNGVAIQPPEDFGPALEALGKGGRRVMADPTGAASFVFDRLRAGGAEIVKGTDPCAMPKACKNETEVDGARAAHRRDGVAVTRFLAWFAERAPAGGLTEIEAAEQLRVFRFENDLIRDLSFRTISGSGPNGAIVHYSVSEETNREIGLGELYLVDSGAQYLDGTTDITRTIAVGEASPEMRDRFTRVLKGHIGIATARFPQGTTGAQLDTLARHALWQAGLDFDHGTGHGVGSYLSVHEGPQRISKAGDTVALKPGMIVSNEPGYYKTDAYGIRIENLVTVVPCDDVADSERTLLQLETMTLAPIDRTLVDVSLLTADEMAWLDAYHARVRETVGPALDPATKTWLDAATRPIGDG